MSPLARSLFALLVAVTANANQPCDIQDCGGDTSDCFSNNVPLPPIKFASPGGMWNMSHDQKKEQELCRQHGYPPLVGVRIKACNNNPSLEYPDIGNTRSSSIPITCAEDHPCPDGITVHVSLCC